MIGLCHNCLISAVEVFVKKGHIVCKECLVDTPNFYKEPEKKIIGDVTLPFEDLPQGTEQERLNASERIAADIFDRHYQRKMNSERVSEVF